MNVPRVEGPAIVCASCGHGEFVETALLEETRQGTFRTSDTGLCQLAPRNAEIQQQGVAAIWLRCVTCGATTYAAGIDKLRSRMPTTDARRFDDLDH